MDLYEFTEILRRQKVLFIGGILLLVSLIAFLSFEYDSGFRLRFQSRYESSIRMAVVPASFDSLGNTLPNVAAMAGTTSLYATLLSLPETADEISTETDIQLLNVLEVTTSGRDGFIGVTATAADAAGAIDAALHSFTWLENRISDPPSIVGVDRSEPEELLAPLLDETGQFLGTIRLDASPAFADSAIGLWVSLSTADSTITVSLADAAGGTSEFAAQLEPGNNMVIALEDVFGKELDAIVVRVPPLPETGPGTYDLVLRLDRGILLNPPTSGTGDETEEGAVGSDPKLLARHVDVSWQQSASVSTVEDQTPTSSSVGLLLLTEKPIASVTGARRGPVLIAAALLGGLFALIVLAVGVDTWKRDKRRSQEEQAAIAELRDTAVEMPVRNEVGERK
jgi:hypothetical protein